MKETFEAALKVGKRIARDAANQDSAYVPCEWLLARDHIVQGVQRFDGRPEAEAPEPFCHPIQVLARAYGL